MRVEEEKNLDMLREIVFGEDEYNVSSQMNAINNTFI